MLHLRANRSLRQQDNAIHEEESCGQVEQPASTEIKTLPGLWVVVGGGAGGGGAPLRVPRQQMGDICGSSDKGTVAALGLQSVHGEEGAGEVDGG